MRCLFCIGSGSEPQHPPKGLTLFGRVRVWDLEYITLGGVDNGGVAAGAYPGQLCIVIQVYVPVDEPFRLVLVQNLVEALKAPVGTVVPVVQSLGRGVGQQQVDAAPFVRLMLQLVHTAAHGLLGVLIGILFIIALTAPQPHDAQTLPCVHLIVHADTAAGFPLSLVTAVVVAVHNSNATSTLTSYFFNYQTMYTQNISSLQTAYETSLHTSDIRFKDERLWEERYEPLVSQPQNYFRKYYENETTAVKQMPLIRLSEMYFIAVENGDTDLFRTYRIARNLDASIDGTLTDQNAIMARLELEYRKDFYGEGQMFFFYKRLGYTSYTWPTVKTVESASYRLPIPETQANFE